MNQINKEIQKMILEFREHTWIKACKRINGTKQKNLEVNIFKFVIRTRYPPFARMETTEDKFKVVSEYNKQKYEQKRTTNSDEIYFNELETWIKKSQVQQQTTNKSNSIFYMTSKNFFLK